MTIEWDRFACFCGTCGGCSQCADGKVPDSITVNFSGIVAQECSVDTDCNASNETVTTLNLSSVNGNQVFPLIYHNGSYTTGYDTDAMGEVSELGGVSGDCISCYEKELTGLGDIYLGNEGGCPGNDWADEDYWLRNVNLRIRIYVDFGITNSGLYTAHFVSIYPDNGGTSFTEAGLGLTLTWDQASDDWFCDGSGTYNDPIDDSTSGYIILQLLLGQFYSLTDTHGLGGLLDNNVATSPSCLGITIPIAGNGTTAWTLTSSATRVAVVA